MKVKMIRMLAIGMLAGCSYITDLKRVGDETTLDISWSGAGEIEIRITANAPCQITTNNDTLIFNQLTLVVNGKGIYTTSDMILKGKSLSISVYGGINKSKHTLAGLVENASYHIQGGTDIDALELSTRSATVIHKSYGDCYLNASNHLQVTIFSTGNVFYTGQPNLTFEQRQNTVMTATGNAIPF
ncbi:MAG: DUF2807 domain-containing protein [Bacteroidales bacterium]|nr:DUF2807 domain-containing protein [Bacteroidales bacterium]